MILKNFHFRLFLLNWILINYKRATSYYLFFSFKNLTSVLAPWIILFNIDLWIIFN